MQNKILECDTEQSPFNPFRGEVRPAFRDAESLPWTVSPQEVCDASIGELWTGIDSYLNAARSRLDKLSGDPSTATLWVNYAVAQAHLLCWSGKGDSAIANLAQFAETLRERGDVPEELAFLEGKIAYLRSVFGESGT